MSKNDRDSRDSLEQALVLEDAVVTAKNSSKEWRKQAEGEKKKQEEDNRTAGIGQASIDAGNASQERRKKE